MQIKTLSLIFLSFLIFCQTTYSAATKADESEKILVPIAGIKEAFAADLEKHTISSWPHQSKELVLEDQKYKASINLGSEVTIPETLERKAFDGPTLGQFLFSLGKNLTLYHAFNARGELPVHLFGVLNADLMQHLLLIRKVR